MDFAELGHRVQYLRNLYARHHVNLVPGEGLALALDEAEALACGDVSQQAPTPDNAGWSAHQAHVIWALQESIRTCVDAGIELRSHLANMATGTTDFGTAAAAPQTIFYKDFEYEVFIMAALIRRGVRVVLPPAPNDPLREFDAEDLPVQLKHPNSRRHPPRGLREFNRALREAGRHGIFVLGVEDMFGLGDGGFFDDADRHDRWLAAKRAEIDAYGRPLLERADRYPQIAGVVQTASFVGYIEGNSKLTRTGNSCVFDAAGREQEPWFEAAMKVLRVFNPDPVRASQLGQEEAV